MSRVRFRYLVALAATDVVALIVWTNQLGAILGSPS